MASNAAAIHTLFALEEGSGGGWEAIGAGAGAELGRVAYTLRSYGGPRHVSFPSGFETLRTGNGGEACVARVRACVGR